MIRNPILQRELVGLLRTRRAMVLQVTLVVLLAALVLLRWPTDARVDLAGSQALQVLQMFGYGMLACVMLLAPVFPATAVVREKRSGTLALLLNSPLRPHDILLGKLGGVVGFILLLLVLSLPAAICCTMAGVRPGQLGSVYLILVLVAVQYATLALLISSFAASTDSALRLTYLAVLVLGVVPLGPHQFLQGMVPAGLAPVVEWVRCLSPIPAMMEALGDTVLTGQGAAAGGGAVGRYALTAALSSALFAGWTMARLNHRLLDVSRAQGKVTDERSTAVRLYRRLMYLWFFDPQRRSGLIGPWTNPVMVKEFRSRRFGRSNWMLRLIALCLIVSLGLMLLTATGSQAWGVDTLGGIMVLLQIALIVLITPSLASGLISSERENGSWRLLQMTPLSTPRIVAGKLMSVLWTLGLILAATLPGYAVLMYVEPGMSSRVYAVLVTLVLTALLSLLVSAAMSSLFTRTAAATAASYLLMVGLCAGTMLVWLLRGAPFTQSAVQAVLQVNPLAAALTLINARGFTDYQLVPVNWWLMIGAGAVCLGVLVAQTWRISRPD